jgi:DNA-binding GntR family transcriptional regulator
MNKSTRPRDGSKIFRILRESILRLDMRPGEVIDEASIASCHSVSRTPIREAIIQLISEGLVIRDGRFARVAPLDFDDVPRLYEALVISSRMIHRLAAEHRTDEDIARISKTLKGFEMLVKRGNGVERQDANVAFHMSIARAAKNSYFEDFYERMLLASSRLSRACFSGDERLDGEEPDEELLNHLMETARQHVLMVEAISDRDIAASDELAVIHQELSFNRLKAAILRGSRAVGSTPDLRVEATVF